MEKNKVKKKKSLAYRIGRKIRGFNRSYFLNLYFLVSSIVVLAIFLSFYLTNHFFIEKNMLFWFFGATSQSMAALFAVVGMFVVFRYQDLQTRLRHYFEILRNNFLSSEWQEYFGNIEVNTMSDSEILDKSKSLLEDKKDEPTYKAYNNLDVYVVVIESHIRIRNKVIVLAKVPMIAILITFIVSIVSLILINVYLSISSLSPFGLVIVLITLILIIFSMTSIFRFFLLSMPIK
jgi:sterol desaturase/sphingolipid hydroxylase (fatty acid hydroxylase superfamily)